MLCRFRLLLLLLPLPLLGQSVPFSFRHLQESAGLSHKLVNCLFRDRDGFLWVGTYGGLNRFDGSHFTVFRYHPRRPETLGSNIVHAIDQDAQGFLWLATEAGISRLDPATGRFRNFHTAYGHNLGMCLNLVCDRQGNVWFSSRGRGLFQYDPVRNQFRQFVAKPGRTASLSNNFVSKNGLLRDDRRNGLWIATEKGLNFLDLTTHRLRNHQTDSRPGALFSPNYTSGLTLNGDTLLYADNTAERIIQYDLRHQTLLQSFHPTSRTGQPVFPVATLFVDRNQTIWLSSWEYVLLRIRSDMRQVEEFVHDPLDRTSVAANFFWDAWQQDDGTIWLGTVNGLSYTNPERTFYRVHNLGRLHPSINDDRGINSFLEDDDGSWWLSTALHELLHYDAVSGRLTPYRIPSSSPYEGGFGFPLLSRTPDPNRLYILLSQSLLVFDKRTRRFAPFDGWGEVQRRLGTVSTLLVSGDSVLFFGRYNPRMLRYHPAKRLWREDSIPFPATHRNRFWVRHAAFDQRRTLWLDVYPGGFVSYADRRWRHIPQPEEAAPYEETFFSFKTDSSNQFWMPATNYGLVRYNPLGNTYRLLGEYDGLGSAEVKAVCPDASGRVWVAAMNKFSVYDPYRRFGRAGPLLNRAGVFPPDENPFLNFSLPLNESAVNYENYMFPLRSGHILCTLKGYLVEFMPERLNVRPVPTRLLISRLDLPDSLRLVQAGQEPVRLGETDNNFSIHYGILNQPQESHSYEYKLEGYDEDWVTAGSRTVASYTRIPGGRYVFMVRAASGTGPVRPAQLEILVATPFYATRWFRAVMVALLAVLMYLLYRYRTRQTARLHRLQMQATRLERDKTIIQYQNLINHLNPHFLFNSLTSLNSLILVEPREASTFLQKLSAMYRYILQSRDKETVTLQHELTFVQHYTDLQKSRFEDALHIDIDIPGDYLLRHIVPVTLQNLFENAIKHNIVDDDAPLTIRVFVDGDSLVVENNLQLRAFVETSNRQGMESLRTLYGYLSDTPLTVGSEGDRFVVRIPLL